jgi:cobalt-zinc-cadmium resistance protein CzcA
VRQQIGGSTGVDPPQSVQPQLRPCPGDRRIYRYRQGNGVSPMELRAIKIGMSAVIAYDARRRGRGEFRRLYQAISVNLDLAAAQKISLQQVFTALGRGNANAGGSFWSRGDQQYLIRGIGLLHQKDDIGNIVVAERNGAAFDRRSRRISSVPRQVSLAKTKKTISSPVSC